MAKNVLGRSSLPGKKAMIGGAAALGAGAAAGAAMKMRKSEPQGRYQIDENTGIVYFDGHAIGEVAMYDDGTTGDGVNELPPEDTGQAHLSIDEGAVGVDTGEEASGQGPESSRASNFVDPLPGDESDQFSLQGLVSNPGDEVNPELYQLRQQGDQLSRAIELLNIGRKAEQYKAYLLDQKKAGAPVGDIAKTVDYLLTQNDQQVKAYKNVLESQPKIQLGATEYSLPTAEEQGAEVKQDYQANRQTYNRLGVNEKDLEYSKYVRVNSFGAQPQLSQTNGRTIGNM